MRFQRFKLYRFLIFMLILAGWCSLPKQVERHEIATKLQALVDSVIDNSIDINIIL